jgi:hypothetical protein
LAIASGIQVKNDGTLRVARVLQTSGRGALQAIRDWVPPVLLIFGYAYMNGIQMRPLVDDRDAQLFAIDHVLAFGHDPADGLSAPRLAPARHPAALSKFASSRRLRRLVITSPSA